MAEYNIKKEVKEALAEQAKGENQNVYTEQESAQLQKPETGEGGNQNVNTEPQEVKQQESETGESREDQNKAEVKNAEKNRLVKLSNRPAKRIVRKFRKEVNGLKATRYGNEELRKEAEEYKKKLRAAVNTNQATPEEAQQAVEAIDKVVEKKAEISYDYSKINELLKKNNLETIINGDIQDSLGNILLTGATGFLGIHVLREILENESGDVYCFIRSNRVLSGEERLKSLLFYYFSDEYAELFGERLKIIEGDITSFEDFEKLMPEKIDTVINCAANVKHFSSGTDIEDINLGGVINGLKFAKMKNAKYVQVSTYSIAGESINNYPPVDVKFTENDLYIGQAVDNQYLSSKFLAERAVLEAAVNDDLDVKIMRVGNLMARSSDSEFQINFETNGFINRLKAFVTIGKMPYSMLMNNVEFSPIDITAKAIVNLSKTPKECTVFHPYDYHSVCFGDIIDIIKPLGLDIEPAEENDYENALDEALADKSKQDGVSGLITSIGSGKVKKIWMPVDNAYTIQALYRLGIKWPFVSEEYIYNFVKYLDDLDFFSV